MSMEYLRKTYGVPARRGANVRYRWHKGGPTTGRVVYATHYVHVRFPGDPQIYKFHPADDALEWTPNAGIEPRSGQEENSNG